MSQTISNIALDVFGLDYKYTQIEPSSMINWSPNQHKVLFQISKLKTYLWPPGAFFIFYKSGCLFDQSTKTYCVDNLKFSWSRPDKTPTNSFIIENKYKTTNITELSEAIIKNNQLGLIQLEFTKPHYVCLESLSKMLGSLVLQIVRFVPLHLQHTNYYELIKYANVEDTLTNMEFN